MAWWHRIPGFGPRGPMRAGRLNTGELILVDDAGHSQIFRPETTDLIRDVLSTEPQSVFDNLPLPPIEGSGDVFFPQGVAHELRS